MPTTRPRCEPESCSNWGCPVTPGAERILSEAGIRCIPDILANAGGAMVSYFEWVQNRQGYYWTLKDVHGRLEEAMKAAGQRVWEVSQCKGIDLRTAAYSVALDRLAQAIESHGTQRYFAQ